jgi:glycosyltransferase involved in cell wall biosynthesis
LIIADSHEFIELYRGDKDLRLGMEMVKLRSDLQFVSFAPDRPSPNDAVRFGIARTADGPIPELPDRFTLELLPSVALRFARKESGGIVSYMPSFPRAVRASRPDVIFENPFTWLTPRSYQTDRVARAMGVPVVYYDPGDEIPVSRRQALLAPFERPVINRAAMIITYNEAGARRFESKYGYPRERIRVIPKPMDVAKCVYHGDTMRVRREVSGGRPESLIVGYLGRLTSYRGSAVLLDVARRAEADSRMSDMRFVFVGGTLSSDEVAGDYHRPNTHVTGMVSHDDVARFVAACDVLVFPDVTNPGGFPTSVAEAMAAGRALVVGIGERTDLMPLIDGETAMLVSPGCSEEIVEVLVRMSEDAALRRGLGRQVGDFAVREMDYPVVARRYLEIADEVCSGRPEHTGSQA